MTIVTTMFSETNPSILNLLQMPPSDTPVICTGWIRTTRNSKNVSFFEINDGSTRQNLQVVFDSTLPDYEQISHAGTGASVLVTGQLVASQGGKQAVELRAETITIIGDADETFPMQKKRHSYEFLREIPHLRLRSNTFGSVFRVRSELAFAIHQFFNQRRFMYVHTPIITASDCEGAGKQFQVTTLDLKAPPRDPSGHIDYTEDFFGKMANLTVSGQLEGECFAQAFKNIYTFGPTFRAENSNTSRHASEFWMIEPEMAFCDLQGDMRLAEDFIKHITAHVLDKCADDIAFFDEWIEKGLRARLEKIVAEPFGVVTYTEAVDLLLKSGKTFEYPVNWGADLQSEHERYLTEEIFNKGIFVINYPKDIKAFYMRLNEDGKTVAAMDLLVPKVGEIIGGAQREERYDVLVAKMEAQGLSAEEMAWYLDLRKYGSTPHAGFGLGFERMLMYVTGMENIRDVMPFPRTPKNIVI